MGNLLNFEHIVSPAVIIVVCTPFFLAVNVFNNVVLYTGYRGADSVKTGLMSIPVGFPYE